jgi:predicted AAA+ superfamily ATPase
MSNFTDSAILQQLTRIANALERQWPPAPDSASLVTAEAYVWHSDVRQLVAVTAVNRLALDLLRGVDEQRDLLMTNTTAFASRLPANNALLWGARGTGKSSLVKSVHGAILASVWIAALSKSTAKILPIYRY